MKQVLLLSALAGLLFLMSCANMSSQEKGPIELGQELFNRVLQTLQGTITELPATATEIVELALNFFYIPEADRNDPEVIEKIGWLFQWLGIHFLYPSTVTQAQVLTATEYKAKFAHLVSNPPSFVEKVYMLTARCSNAGGSTSFVTLPMITVAGQTRGYFYTIFVQTTDSATSARIYPQLVY